MTEVCLCSRPLLWPFPCHYGKAGFVAVVYTQCSFALFQLLEGRLWPGQEPGAIGSISRAVMSCLCCFSPNTARFTWPRAQGLPVQWGNLVWMGPGTGNGENHSSELQVPDPSSWVLLQYYCRNGILEGHVPCQLIQSAAAQN